MAFQKRKLDTQNKKTYRKPSSTKKKIGVKKPKRSIILRLFGWSLFFLFFFGCIAGFILYKKVIEPLPSINELENIDIAEASIIYDREGNELYKIFKENRIYKNYDDISKNIINALVAGEDKRYWENPGVDFIGLIRAGLYGIIGKNEGFGGTSTLTQQLIRNTIIENRSSQESVFDKIERKIKEIYLAFKLTNGVSKEKIIELYLNKIDYGSNSFGIEQAAQTFFGKSAKDVNILEASMLASLPKGPTYYSPYNNFERLVGYPFLYRQSESDITTSLISKTSIEENNILVQSLKDFISGLEVERFSDSKMLICGLKKENLKSNISIDKDGCSVIDYSSLLTLLNAIKIPDSSDEDRILEYQTGRKDFILGRMLEDNYISFEEYKESLINSIGFEFQLYKEDIKYPYFVFYVREYLEEKYGRELLERGGLRIFTSIDPKLQDEAEAIVEKYGSVNETKFGAQNAALISLDNETGEILAMVGGRNYFDEENKGNNNIVTSRLQPGSSFKPFVYSIAIDKEIIGTKTPIYDLQTTFPGNYTPGNFDGKFMGKMNVSTALNYSRNIPAVKMFFLAGGEESIIDWMEKLGVSSIRAYKNEYLANYGRTYTYGASMALGTAMMTPLELAQAYSVYANMGYRKDLIPVIKILDTKGLVIEEFKKEANLGIEVIDSSTAYITNHILSDTGARPEFWNSYLSLSGRPVAAKTGTSTKQEESGGKKIIYPRNLWTVGYTPQITTVVWAGNNDGEETKLNGNGLEAAGPIWRDFMKFYHQDKAVLQWNRPSGVKQVDISKVSGMLAPETLRDDLRVSSLFVNVPQSFDASFENIQVDLLCNGKVDERTPISAIGNVQLLSLHSLQPTNPAWELPVKEWVSKGEYQAELGNIGSYVTSVQSVSCERTNFVGNIEVGSSIQDSDTLVNGSNYVEIAYRSSASIIKLEVFLDEEKIKQVELEGKNQGVYIGDINIPKGTTGVKNLTIRAIDNEYYSEGISYAVNIIKRDNQAPVINLTNPIDASISLYEGDFFNLRGTIEERGNIRSINIYIDNSPIKIGLTGREFTQEIGSTGLTIGSHIVKIEAVDMDFNIGTTEVKLEVIEK